MSADGWDETVALNADMTAIVRARPAEVRCAFACLCSDPLTREDAARLADHLRSAIREGRRPQLLLRQGAVSFSVLMHAARVEPLIALIQAAIRFSERAT